MPRVLNPWGNIPPVDKPPESEPAPDKTTSNKIYAVVGQLTDRVQYSASYIEVERSTGTGRGRATKQDGRLERELRAEAVPEGRRRQEDSRTAHRVRCPSSLTTAATQNHVRGPRRSGTQGRKLATRPRPIRPDKRGGVASSEDRGRRAGSGKEQAE
ncbi:hypothetical protein NDU88_006086 [Pleurodeles waltl]|uniref:Uncharacterized protein n=1 Tax=Pleurodeles waltl TaxID=8319 RepID=A0AAV7RPA0_PLEWA|nr:hypothetical protein NDU88_006086 [Pleurodeles waltl]